ncbi:UvrD-helicase domain-containing protein [Acinetobacter sp.]|uniref:UvrD-helicase domain-containing protein n=1 Tax=Acinetobacter sp. TaxID=472 RepID=UPI003CFC47C7
MTFKNTTEQEKIINYTGHRLVVKAFAGAGKTSTLVSFAKKNPHVRFLYIAYNTAIKNEASKKFPNNVECKTSHGLAYAKYGKIYKDQNKLKPNIRLRDIAPVLGMQDYRFLNLVNETLHNYLNSSNLDIMPGHIPQIPGENPVLTEKELGERKAIVAATAYLWKVMKDPGNNVPISHDGYLKMFQLSKPNLSRKYSAILVDEAQDITPVVNSILLDQACHLIYVGDPHQQIYRWRGAENAMDYKELENADRLNLTNSFRFGQQIAYIANCILNLKGENIKINGLAANDNVYTLMSSYRELLNAKQVTILSRTVSGVILSAFEQARKNKKIFWIGGINNYPLFLMEDIYWLYKGQNNKIKDKMLFNDFPSYYLYKNFGEATSNWEIIRNCKFVEDYDEQIPVLLGSLSSNHCSDIKSADVVVSTVHRAKGLEFENVIMAEDFPDVLALENTPVKFHDELNLLYVAATRATKNLVINSITEEIVRDYLCY